MFPRSVFACALALIVCSLSATLAPAAEAPYFEGFDTTPPNGVPANFVETPDSAWSLTPGTYIGGASTPGTNKTGTSISLTNVAGHNFTVRTKFKLVTNGGLDFRLADMSLVALADNPDVTASGYHFQYYASGLSDVYGKLFLGNGYTNHIIKPSDSMIMTLHGAYLDGLLYLTGSLDNGSRILTVSTVGPAPSTGSYFGFSQHASVSSPHGAYLNGYYDDFSVNFETKPVKFGNIATRVTVGTVNDVAIAGFIVTGDVPKRVLLRGSDSDLSSSQLGDTTLELRRSDGGLVAFNDNWENTQAAEIYATGLEPNGSYTAAIIAVLNPGPYTAVLRGKGAATGIGLIEVYDVDVGASSKLSNISTRGQVGTGDNAMIAGVIVSGDAKAHVIVRALGPSLAAAGIERPLADPTLELRDRDGGLVRSNNNWRETEEAEIMATSIPPTNEAEAAIVADLLPTNYMAIVRGKNDTTGVALVEVYHLN
jgi:hypothetical protein